MCRTYILNIYHRVLFVSLLFYFHVSPLDFRARVEYTPEGPWPIPNIPNTLARLSVFPLRRIFIIHFASAVSTARIMQIVGRFRESKLFLPVLLTPRPVSSSFDPRGSQESRKVGHFEYLSHFASHSTSSRILTHRPLPGNRRESAGYPMSYIPSSSSSSSFFILFLFVSHRTFVRFLRASRQRITPEGHPTWLNPRPAIPSPFVPLPNPRSSCTWHAAYPLGRRRAAAAGRPLRDPSTGGTGRGGALVRRPRPRTRHVSGSSHPRSGTLRVIVSSLF